MKREVLPRKAFDLAELVDYVEGSSAKRTIAKSDGGGISVFAFDVGQGLSEYSTSLSALVQVLDGEAELRFGEQSLTVHAGQIVLMPAGVSHGVKARQRSKILMVTFRAK
jgi:quercetin dioxygenase-like cupin family protein